MQSCLTATFIHIALIKTKLKPQVWKVNPTSGSCRKPTFRTQNLTLAQVFEFRLMTMISVVCVAFLQLCIDWHQHNTLQLCICWEQNMTSTVLAALYLLWPQLYDATIACLLCLGVCQHNQWPNANYKSCIASLLQRSPKYVVDLFICHWSCCFSCSIELTI